jgi:arylsulfatase A-like enzyme
MNKEVSRRFFIQSLAAGAVLHRVAAGPFRSSKPRNILMIAVDDLKPLLGCYGDETAITPHIDRLAASGLACLNNHCQQAICGPTRASLLTGLRPDKTKVWDLKAKLRKVNPDVVSLPQYFRGQDYVTAGVGKVFDVRNVDKKCDEPSWSIPFLESHDLPSNQELGAPFLGRFHNAKSKAVMSKAEGEGITGYAQLAKYAKKNGAFPVVECEDVPDNAYRDGQIAIQGIKFLEQFKQGGQPFFLAVGFRKPHLPFVAPKKYWDMYDRNQFKVHPYQERSAGGPEVAYHSAGEIRQYTGVSDFDSYSDAKSDHMPEELQKELIHGYYACVSFIDAQVGLLMKAIKRQGFDKNTVVVLWGDHGWHLGDHGLWCKHSNFEQATRSPLIFASPDWPAAGKTQSPTEFVDVFPTLCELAGVSTPGNLDGTSLVPLMKNPKASVKPFAVSQYPRSGNVMGYAIRDGRYRYVEWIKDCTSDQPYGSGKVVGRELYDYQADPLETKNAVNNPEYRETEQKLRRQLHEFFKQHD